MTLIRVEHRTDNRPLRRLLDGLDNIPTIVEGVVSRVATRTSKRFLPQLQAIPPRRRMRSEDWTSERQRKAYHASNGFGAGIPYKRTGKTSKAWTVSFRKQRGGIGAAIRFENKSKAAPFVFGSLNQRSVMAAQKPQQRFHRTTGWPFAQPIIGEAIKFAQNEIADEIEDTLRRLDQPGFARRSRTIFR